LPLRARRHVAVDEGLGQQTRRWPEVTEQVSREAALLGFGQGTRVMRDHPAQQKVCAFDVAEIPSAVQWMESGVMQIRGIADVVQPRRRFD